MLGEGSAQYAITAFWSAVAYKAPVTFLVVQNSEYAILKWFAEVEQVSGAPGLDLPKLDVASVAEGYGVKAHRVGRSRRGRRRALRGARLLASPELVEVPVAPGMSSSRESDGTAPARQPTCSPRGDEPAPDRAPDEIAAGVAQPLRGELEALLGPERLLAQPSDIVRYASDASPYRLFPRAVVMAHDADDVAKVLAYGREKGIPVTFRAGGTSLNGQGQSDGILVDVRRHFGGIAVEEDGARARVKPGTVLGHANRVLAPHGRKLGPDPASTDIATVGGVVANNSGGMRCGVDAGTPTRPCAR